MSAPIGFGVLREEVCLGGKLYYGVTAPFSFDTTLTAAKFSVGEISTPGPSRVHSPDGKKVQFLF
jgi:hypothetical protein